MIEQLYNNAKSLLAARLYAPYQQEGVMWMLTMENNIGKPKGGFLCDEMGLGKTVQLIATILGNKKRKTLIVVPKSIVSQWVDEITKFAPSLRCKVWDGPDRDSTNINFVDVVVAPYSVIRMGSRLHGIHWDRIILDEAHEIRNRNSKIFKNVNALRSDIRWVVTGTPVFNSMNDFVSLCEFVGIPRVLVQGMSNKVKDIYILRRTKEDLDMNDIPECHFENVELEMYKEERRLYEYVFEDAQETVREIFKTTTNISAKNMELLECLLRARQCCIWPQMYYDGVAKKTETEAELWVGGSRKMDTLFRMIEGHPDEKALVFCQFTGEMNHIQKNIKGPVFRIDGSVSKEDRLEQMRLFKKAQSNAVLIIQIKSGGTGLNLQEATRVYITAPSWNPATELQAVGRSHRSGQTKTVYVKKFVYEKSVEEDMMALQGHKSTICAEVLHDKRLEDQIPVKERKSSISILDIKKIFRA
jgi:SNF2 family DNA or RNA helicase